MNTHERTTMIRDLTDEEIGAVAGGDLLGTLTGGHYGSIAEAVRKGLDEAVLSQQH
jgi:hypothetical protein